MVSHAIKDTVLRLLPRFAQPSRPGVSPPVATGETAFCLDTAAGGLDVAGLRASARRLGLLPPERLGWFGELLRERVERSLTERITPDWEALYPRTTADERADRHIAQAARRAALSGGLAAAGAHVGEVLTILTEGLAAPICLPAVVASLASEIVASAKVQIDLVFDLGSIYGVPSDVSDTGELAEIFDLALHAGKADGAWRAGEPPRPATEDEILARLGRSILEDAVLGLVPFVGIPVSAAGSYRATMRVGAAARRFVRRRAALREALRRLTFDGPRALLVEGAWLLATADGIATYEELLAVAAVARSLSSDERAAALHGVRHIDVPDERCWLERVSSLDAHERAALADAMAVVAGLRGPTRHPERCFLARAGAALGVPVDLERIEAIHQGLEGAPPAS
jgi:hypothetical protein